MRLINTRTRLFEEFIGEDIPEYAILSHTWGADEVSYQDYTSGTHKSKSGYRKIKKTCVLAAEAGIRHVWIDTCCIDKKSSAELSEAINSMYRWYEQSKICYAFLSDLSGGSVLSESLGQCRWFSRGWTLQELVAPKLVLFFDAEWNARGFKTEIAAELSNITNIDEKVLRNECPLSEFCVAQKLSWAARRRTTRIEDSAYCLLGLLELNMPLLYGEGKNAFRRLQEEIIRSTADLSIFAWRLKTSLELEQEAESTSPFSHANYAGTPSLGRLPVIFNDIILCGVLAGSAAAFFDCSKYKIRQHGLLREFSITNIGIKIRAQILGKKLGYYGSKGYVLPLNCTLGGRAIGLCLRQVGHDEYLRADPYEVYEYDPRDMDTSTTRPAERHLLTALPKELFTRPSIMCYTTELVPIRRMHILQIVATPTVLPSYPWPASHYDNEDQVFFVSHDSSRDFSIVAVDILIKSMHAIVPKHAWVRCNFCAIGWSSMSPNVAQFGILGEDSDTEKLHEIQPRVSEWDANSTVLAYMLNHNSLLKARSVRHFLPELDCVAHITFDAQRQEDPSKSINPFFSITFSYTTWTLATEPNIDQVNWKLP